MLDRWNMEYQMPMGLSARQQTRLFAQLRASNETAAQFGLMLTQTDMAMLAERRFETLQKTGRVEFGESVLPKLARAFCDSPYINRQEYAQILADLQELFYTFKGDTLEQISDDALIDFMRQHFDTDCHGSVSALGDLTSEDLCRRVRFGKVREKDLRRATPTPREENLPWDN